VVIDVMGFILWCSFVFGVVCVDFEWLENYW